MIISSARAIKVKKEIKFPCVVYKKGTYSDSILKQLCKCQLEKNYSGMTGWNRMQFLIIVFSAVRLSYITTHYHPPPPKKSTATHNHPLPAKIYLPSPTNNLKIKHHPPSRTITHNHSKYSHIDIPFDIALLVPDKVSDFVR